MTSHKNHIHKLTYDASAKYPKVQKMSVHAELPCCRNTFTEEEVAFVIFVS